MRTVIGFDSWAQGAHHFERLIPALERRGYRLILIHLGSWGHDPARAREERVGQLLVRDIAYYDGLGFADILRREAPSAVVFLSTQAYAHRAFNRYCRSAGIPTMHLYHGLVSVQNSSSRRPSAISWRRQAALVADRAAKNIGRILPTYAAALARTKAAPADWSWFVRDLVRKLAGTSYSGVAAPDASTTTGCVYVQADIAHASGRYRIPRENVFAVGNPDLPSFGLGPDLMALDGSRQRSAGREIVYIESALVTVGEAFDDVDDFIAHMRQTSESVREQGYDLVVKLHPAHSQTSVPARLADAGIMMCEGDDFVSRLAGAAAVIAEPSSAAVLPALMGVPLLLAKHGKLATQEYGVVLRDYPRAAILSDIRDAGRLMTQGLVGVPPDSVRAWIDENAGPLPASEMPDRVATELDRMVRACAELT